MMWALRRAGLALAAGLLAAGIAGFVPHGVSVAAPQAPAPGSEAANGFNYGHVYLLRGLANVWSRGLDKLGEQLTAKGVRWSIHNHAAIRKLAAEAVESYKKDPNFAPIMIVGHSLGADAATLMADYIGREGVPIRLMVTFDGVARQDATKKKTELLKEDGHKPFSRVTANVEEVLNFYISTGWGREMVPGPGFTGKIENVDVKDVPKVNHINIEKQPEFQARTVDLIVQILSKEKPKSASN